MWNQSRRDVNFENQQRANDKLIGIECDGTAFDQEQTSKKPNERRVSRVNKLSHRRLWTMRWMQRQIMQSEKCHLAQQRSKVVQ